MTAPMLPYPKSCHRFLKRFHSIGRFPALGGLTVLLLSVLHYCLPVLAVGLLGSCVTSIDLVEVARATAEKQRGPAPEAEWNAKGVWQRVADNPATYIPKDYPASAPRGTAEGTWVIDQRDGKRLFVPRAPVGGYPPAVLLGDAKKVTNWQARQITSTQPGVIVM
jgi:hypothetical protein